MVYFPLFCNWFTVKGNKVQFISLKKRVSMVISKHSFFRVNDNTTSLVMPSGRFVESINILLIQRMLIVLSLNVSFFLFFNRSIHSIYTTETCRVTWVEVNAG